MSSSSIPCGMKILYALRMLQAGVAVELHSFPGTFHGSLVLPNADVSQREMAEMVAVLKKGLIAQLTSDPSWQVCSG